VVTENPVGLAVRYLSRSKAARGVIQVLSGDTKNPREVATTGAAIPAGGGRDFASGRLPQLDVVGKCVTNG
jgi:hypothetical protein